MKIDINPVKYKLSFSQITDEFDELFYVFNPLKNAFKIINYFSEGKSVSFAKNALYELNIIPEPKDFMGIYVMIKGNKPFYVGRSKHVLKRINQHVKGESHHTSTLAYLVAKDYYKHITGLDYTGKRNELDYNKYVVPAKDELIQQNVAIFPINNSVQLYLFEIYCAMKLRTPYNKFETH